jgi:hypothetical protein
MSAAVCPTCDGEGSACKNFGIDSAGMPDIVPCPDCTPQRWQSVELDDTGWQCGRCGEPVGLIDTEDPTGGMFPVAAWQCRVTGELVCEDCHGQDGTT